jgi:predicted HTH transcriptional regulator
MAIPVEPIVNEDQLRLLINEQHESAELDYKRALDLVASGRRRTIVELTKDIAAMASTNGGYMAIGLDDHGQPVGIDKEHADALDEASLRQQVERYLPAGVELRTAVHESRANSSA